MEINGITRGEGRNDLWDAALAKYGYLEPQVQHERTSDATNNAVSEDAAAKDIAPSQVVQGTTSTSKADQEVDRSQRQIAQLEQALQKQSIHVKTAQASESVAQAEARIARRAQAQQAKQGDNSLEQANQQAAAQAPYNFTSQANNTIYNFAQAATAQQQNAIVEENVVEEDATEQAQKQSESLDTIAQVATQQQAQKPQAAQHTQNAKQSQAKHPDSTHAKKDDTHISQKEYIQRELDEQQYAQTKHVNVSEQSNVVNTNQHSTQTAQVVQDSSTAQNNNTIQQQANASLDQQGEFANSSNQQSSDQGFAQNQEQSQEQAQAIYNQHNVQEENKAAQQSTIDESKFAFVNRDEDYEVAVSNEGEILSIVDPNEDNADQVVASQEEGVEGEVITADNDVLNASAGIAAYTNMQYGEVGTEQENQESAAVEQEVELAVNNPYVAQQASQEYSFYQQGASDQAISNQQAMQSEGIGYVQNENVEQAQDGSFVSSYAPMQGMSEANQVSEDASQFLNKNDEAFLSQIPDRQVRQSLSQAIGQARSSGKLQGPLTDDALFSKNGILKAKQSNHQYAPTHYKSASESFSDGIVSRAASVAISVQEVRDNLISLGTTMVDALATISKLPLDIEDPVTRELKSHQKNEQMEAFMLKEDPKEAQKKAEEERIAREKAQKAREEQAKEQRDNEQGSTQGQTISAQRYQQDQFVQSAREEQRIQSMPTAESLGIFNYDTAMSKMQNWADDTYRELLSDSKFQTQIASGSSSDRDFMSVLSSSQNFEM